MSFCVCNIDKSTEIFRIALLYSCFFHLHVVFGDSFRYVDYFCGLPVFVLAFSGFFGIFVFSGFVFVFLLFVIFSNCTKHPLIVRGCVVFVAFRTIILAMAML